MRVTHICNAPVWLEMLHCNSYLAIYDAALH